LVEETISPGVTCSPASPRVSGRPESWHICPRNDVYAPGQGVNAHMRL
jgi:hypothetical protein